MNSPLVALTITYQQLQTFELQKDQIPTDENTALQSQQHKLFKSVTPNFRSYIEDSSIQFDNKSLIVCTIALHKWTQPHPKQQIKNPKISKLSKPQLICATSQLIHNETTPICIYVQQKIVTLCHHDNHTPTNKTNTKNVRFLFTYLGAPRLYKNPFNFCVICIYQCSIDWKHMQ